VRLQQQPDAWIIVGYLADGRIAVQRALKRIENQVDPKGKSRGADVEQIHRTAIRITRELLSARAAQAAQRPRRCESFWQWIVIPRKNRKLKR
jgi:hypothetical protein